MLDSDQSYLLQSYNENQQLFSNVNMSSQLKKSNNYQPRTYYPQYNQSKPQQKTKWRYCMEYGSQNDVGMDIAMLNSIDQDQKQYDKSAGKVDSQLGTRDRRVKSNYHSKLRLSQNKPQRTTTATKPILNTQWKTQYKQPTQQQKQLQIFSSIISKNRAQSERKLTQLQKILLNLYEKYSELVDKLVVCQQLVQKQSRIIQEQDYMVKEWSNLWEVVGRKIQLWQSYDSVPEYAGIDIRRIRQQISNTIQRKVYSAYFQTNTNITIGSKQHNMVNQPINSTKSVPILSGSMYAQQHKYNNEGYTIHYDSPATKQTTKQPPNYPDQTTNPTNHSNTPQTIIHLTHQIRTEPNQYCYQDNKQNNNDTYRKLTNIRIKQLQNQNLNLENQLQSANIKIMVIRQENKQLREIVQGLIKQVEKLTGVRNGGRRYQGY